MPEYSPITLTLSTPEKFEQYIQVTQLATQYVDLFGLAAMLQRQFGIKAAEDYLRTNEETITETSNDLCDAIIDLLDIDDELLKQYK